MLSSNRRRFYSLFPTAALLAGLAVSSQTATASIIIDSFNTSHSVTINIPDPPHLPITARPIGVNPAGTTIGGARMLAAHVRRGQEDDSYRLRVSNASGFAVLKPARSSQAKG